MLGPRFRRRVLLCAISVGCSLAGHTEAQPDSSASAADGPTPLRSESPPTGYFRSYVVSSPDAANVTRQQMSSPDHRWRRALVNTGYLGGYTFAASLGIRRGIGHEFRVIRLESAYAYDFVAHVWVANQVGRLFSSITRWAGYPDKTSRRRGAWLGAFGMMTFMEICNGFVPTARLDPLDIPANAIGAWLADGYIDIVERHPHLLHFTLEFGWKSMDRLLHGKESSRLLGNAWHDYPNGRFGLGYHVGSVDRPWITVFVTYTINSMDIETLRNQFGFGVELPVVAWAAPAIEMLPGGDLIVGLYSWLDERFLMPLFYIQIYEVDTPAWSNRKPFAE